MATYIIEGTITELSANNKGKFTSFKICGAEGYAVKRNKTSYNLLCSTENATNENIITAFILFSERTYKASEKQLSLLASALAGGRRVKITVEATEDKIKTGVSELPVSSLTLLSD